MPNLKQLLEELEELQVSPKDIKIRPDIYDSFIADAEDVSEDNEDQHFADVSIGQIALDCSTCPILTVIRFKYQTKQNQNLGGQNRLVNEIHQGIRKCTKSLIGLY